MLIKILTPKLIDEIGKRHIQDKVLDFSQVEKFNISELMPNLLQAIKDNGNITEVKFYAIKLNDEFAAQFAQIPSLENLEMEACKISAAGAKAIAESSSRKLKKLNLSSNPINNKGADYFRNNQHIIELDLSSCNITDDGAAPLFENSHLQVLYLNGQRINSESLLGLKENKTLKKLDLSNNNITKENISYITSSALKDLNIGGNDIGDEGAKTLADSQSLKTLNVHNCDIGDEGACALAANNHIKNLVITLNSKITEKGRKILEKRRFENLNITGRPMLNKNVHFQPALPTSENPPKRARKSPKIF